MNIKIVYVALGKIPTYLKTSILQAAKFNPIKDVWVITDDTNKYEEIQNLGCNVQLVKDLPQTKTSNEFEKIKTTYFDQYFRDGFWLKTTERFFILERFSQMFSKFNYFHLENDNMIYFGLNEFNQQFEQFDFLVSYFSKTQSMASVLWLKNTIIIQKFCKFCIDKLKSNTEENDMSLCRKFVDDAETNNDISVFPLTDKIFGKTDSSTNFEKFKSIFDSAPIGQLYFGYDPNNWAGQIIKEDNRNCDIKFSAFELVWRNDELKRRIPYLISKKDQTHILKVNNLHMHCKMLDLAES